MKNTMDVCTLQDILHLAENHNESTYHSLEQAVEFYQESTDRDLQQVAFTLVDYPLEALTRPHYQDLYTSVEEVGAFQRDSGRHESVAQEQMDWFNDIVQAARDTPSLLFPGLLLERDGKLKLIDGNHRSSARGIAGHASVPLYVGREAC